MKNASIAISWERLKSKELPLSFAEANGNVYIYAILGALEYICVLELASPEGEEWSLNYKDSATGLV